MWVSRARPGGGGEWSRGGGRICRRERKQGRSGVEAGRGFGVKRRGEEEG
jgi:hypothetical protein